MITRAFNTLPIGATFTASILEPSSRFRKVSGTYAQPVGPGAGPFKNFQGSIVRLEPGDERRAWGLTLLAKVRGLEVALEDAGLNDAADLLLFTVEDEVEDAFGLTVVDLTPANPNDYPDARPEE